MKPKRIAAISLLVLIATVAVLYFRKPPTQLEQRKAALRARGETLTAAEFLPHPQSPAATLDAITNLTKQLRDTAVYPSALTPMEMISTGKARCAWRAQDVAGHTWTDFDAQLSNAHDTLAEIRSLLATRPLHLGWDYKDWSASPREHFFERRTAVHWLGGAALNELHHGRFTDALDNLHALIDAANTYDEHWTFVNQMIRISITDFGLRVTWEALQAPNWTETQLSQIQTEWSQVPIFNSMECTFEGERVVALEAFQQARARHTNSLLNQYGPNLSGSNRLGRAVEKKFYQPIWRTIWSTEDEAAYLEWSQSHLDAIRRAIKAHNWQELDRELDQLRRQQPRATTLNELRFPISEATRANTWKGLGNAAQTETFRQMTVAAIALRRFELSKGRPPQSLAALIPQFVTRMPIDCMDGKPLRYRLTSDGQWILYSVGRDGIDNGGTPVATDPAAKSPEFWSTRDVLWPIAESFQTPNRLSRHPGDGPQHDKAK
jgi:hypothetical protein